MQTLLDKFRNIAWTAGKTAVVATTTAAALTGGAIATDQAINPYSQLENNIQRAVLLEDGVVIKRSFDVRTDRPEFVMHRNEKEGLSMSYNSQTKGNRSAFSKKFKYKTNNETVEILPYQGTTTQGVKMNVVLQSQPATSTFYFDVPNHDKYLFNQGTSTIFAFQKEGYHPLKEGVEGYKIHEPLIYDSNGNEVYGELVYKNGQVQVIVPERFLVNAVYPVVVDPLVSFDVSDQGTDVTGIFFKPDGLKFYINDGSAGVHQYSLSTAWDISTASYDSISTTTPHRSSSFTGDVFFSSDGQKMYDVGFLTDSVYQYSLSTAWDISTANFNNITYDVGTQEGSPRDVFIKPDGTEMYVTGNATPGVQQYTLSSAWDISSASHTNSFNSSSEDDSPYAFYIRSDGTKMFLVDVDFTAGNVDISQYSLSTAWDISTASYDSISTTTDYSESIFFKPDGLKVYLSPGSLMQSYALCTSWDISSIQDFNCPLEVTTSAVDNITSTTGDGNGEITSLGTLGEDASERGFVYDTVSRAEPTGSGTTLNDSESFETNLGDWTNDAGNVSDWIRDSGGTPSSATGPSSGQDGSYYIYVETSSGNSYSNGDTDIITYNIGSSIDGYVDFYYHQYGDDQGTLSLEGYDGSSWTEIWSSTGDQGNQWNNVGQASTEFSGYSQLRFKNVAVGSFNGDVALDNINVYEEDPVPSPAQSDYTSVENETGTFGTGTFSLTLSGLTAGTTYYVRAYAENSEGYSYGDEVNFTTNAAGGGVTPQSIYNF